MPKLSNASKGKLSNALTKINKRESLWKGPSSDDPHGGITYSMLSKFLVDRERFRLAVVEGLHEEEAFNHRMEYGNMWHVCEEAVAGGASWQSALKHYCVELIGRYGNKVSYEINKWYRCCLVQFPIYLEYWGKHKDEKGRKPIFQEEVFSVQYILPSGREVRMRGKFDSGDLIAKAIWVKENKTKSEVDSEKLQRELPFDLQSMMYLTALERFKLPDGIDGKYPIGGVRYNVVRRPLSGMKFNIKQKKGRGKAKVGAETTDEFYERLGKLIKENAKDFFVRINMGVSPNEIITFQRRCLDSVLEQLCDWWESIEADPFNPWESNGQPNKHHYLFPYGTYNPALEGRVGVFDNYLTTGDERGLVRRDTLFTELQ